MVKSKLHSQLLNSKQCDEFAARVRDRRSSGTRKQYMCTVSTRALTGRQWVLCEIMTAA